MQWDGKFGPAFVATIVIAFIQIGVFVFGAGMIWSDVRKTQTSITDVVNEHQKLTLAVTDAKLETVKREGVVNIAISEIKQTLAGVVQVVQRLEGRVEGSQPSTVRPQ